MIRRDDSDGLLLFTQDDHARLSGEMARAFGNGRFARPEPWTQTMLGIAMHDSGWPLHDEAPTLNGQGLPLHVFETPPPLGVRIWAASAQQATEEDGYAGLLVSIHGLHLSVLLSDHVARQDLPQEQRLQNQFLLNRFQHQEVERQEQLRRGLGLRTDLPLRCGLAQAGSDEREDRLEYGFRLLQAMDQLSLALLCTEDLFPALQLAPAPGRPREAVKVERPGPGRVRLDPWPFEPAVLELSIPVRQVSAGPYPDQAALHQAWRAAAPRAFGIEVSPGGV